MRLSTRTTYGMRAMLALAQAYGQGPLMLKDIAEQQHLPATYLEQIMVPLRKAGLVMASRGAHGGYRLARHPGAMTLLEFIEVLEGAIQLADCPTDTGCSGQPDASALTDLWDDASQALRDHFSGQTLADLAERQRRKMAGPVLMYEI